MPFILKSKMFYTYHILDSFAHWGDHKEEKKSFLMYCHHHNSSIEFSKLYSSFKNQLLGADIGVSAGFGIT